MSIWASWGDEDEVHAVAYREGFSNHYPLEREDDRLTLDFAHIPMHLVKQYRRQRWLRVGVGWQDAETMATFCLTVKEAMKLATALDHFIHQPERDGGGE